MPTRTVRISATAYRTLRKLADADGLSLQAEVDCVVERYRRQRILEEANSAFARMRSDEAAWQEELDERTAWNAALEDGIES